VRAVELFAGAGGAALGMHSAGVEHLACVEKDDDCCATLGAAGFPTVQGDVRDLSLLVGLKPDLVWASFPCQCWSTAGKKEGPSGENGFPWTVDAIEALSPRWCILENVTGLTQHRGSCDPVCLGPSVCPASYLDLVIFPELLRFFEWVDYRTLDAADYGVPQHRRRIFIVAGPSRIHWPAPTHCQPTAQVDLFGRQLKPWRTVGGALNLSEDSTEVVGWHTETNTTGGLARLPRSMDLPSSSPVAGGNAHGGLGLNYADGTRRRLSPEECAALQGFPAEHPFTGTKTSRYRQAGNAVPPKLAQVVAEAVLRADAQNPRGFVETDGPRKLRGNAT